MKKVINLDMLSSSDLIGQKIKGFILTKDDENNDLFQIQL